jgi:hypothetical protein
VDHPQIAAFARLAKENTPPVRALEGQKTLISRTMHGFAYDAVHDEIVVTSPLAQAVLFFKGDANGETPPARVIQGPHTRIDGPPDLGNDRVTVDPVNDEVYVPAVPSSILVFDRKATGDVPPKRVLTGPDTGFQASGIRGMATVAVDAIHNVLVVNHANQLLIFDRTASGNTKPLRVISGPNSGVGQISSFQIYAPKGWILANGQGGFIGVWSIEDNGDIPPRWKIPVQQLTGYTASGIALDPAHEEVLLSCAGQRARPRDGIANAVLTFSWPEIYK